VARHSGNGKNTVEGCRSIDGWNGIGLAIFNCRGAFRVPGRATASAWPRSTYKPSAISWHLNTVAAHATIIGAIPYSGSPSHGQRAGSGESGPGLFVRLLQRACTAVAVSTICTVPGDCSPAAIAISLLMRANGNRPICGGLKITKGPNAAGWKPEHA
jgi:hypothetical protein